MMSLREPVARVPLRHRRAPLASIVALATILLATAVVLPQDSNAAATQLGSAGPSRAIGGWEISRTLPGAQIDRRVYPRFFLIFAGGWTRLGGEPSNLIDIARHRTWGPNADLVFARTIVGSDREQEVVLAFGASERVDLFFNGVAVPVDAVDLRTVPDSAPAPLETRATVELQVGLNEIFFMVEGSADDWNLVVRADVDLEPPVRDHGRLTKEWETSADFLTPESVRYDPRREVLYVSNFDVNYATTAEATGFISRLGLDGEILDLRWIDALDAPTGMGIIGDRLYVLERRHVAEIDIPRGAVVDGIRVTNDGDYLVSHWEGQVYVVSPGGDVVEILDTLPEAVNNTADFEFVAERDRLVIPGFLGNRVVAYRLSPRNPERTADSRGGR